MRRTRQLASVRPLTRPLTAAAAALLLGAVASAQATVPDLDLVNNPKTLPQVQSQYGSQWSDFAVVQEVPANRQNSVTLVRQEPDAGSQLTAGQLMHLYVQSSEEEVGPLDGQPLLQWGTIVGTIAFVICIGMRIFRKG